MSSSANQGPTDGLSHPPDSAKEQQAADHLMGQPEPIPEENTMAPLQETPKSMLLGVFKERRRRPSAKSEDVTPTTTNLSGDGLGKLLKQLDDANPVVLEQLADGEKRSSAQSEDVVSRLPETSTEVLSNLLEQLDDANPVMLEPIADGSNSGSATKREAPKSGLWDLIEEKMERFFAKSEDVAASAHQASADVLSNLLEQLDDANPQALDQTAEGSNSDSPTKREAPRSGLWDLIEEKKKRSAAKSEDVAASAHQASADVLSNLLEQLDDANPQALEQTAEGSNSDSPTKREAPRSGLWDLIGEKKSRSSHKPEEVAPNNAESSAESLNKPMKDVSEADPAVLKQAAQTIPGDELLVQEAPRSMLLDVFKEKKKRSSTKPEDSASRLADTSAERLSTGQLSDVEPAALHQPAQISEDQDAPLGEAPRSMLLQLFREKKLLSSDKSKEVALIIPENFSDGSMRATEQQQSQDDSAETQEAESIAKLEAGKSRLMELIEKTKPEQAFLRHLIQARVRRWLIAVPDSGPASAVTLWKPSVLLRSFTQPFENVIRWQLGIPVLLLLAALTATSSYNLLVRSEEESVLLASVKNEIAGGQYSKAQKLVNRGISLYPDSPYCHFYKSQLLDKQGLKEKALGEIMVACSAQPDDLELIALRAQLRTECGDLKQALSDFDQLTRNKEWSSKPSVIAGKVRVEMLLGDDNKALNEINEAISRQPAVPAFFAARAELNAKLKNYEQALGDWTHVIALSPNDASAYAQRALLEYQVGQTAGSTKDLAMSLKIAPNATAYLNRGIISQEQNHLAAAIKDFRSALKIEPDDFSAIQHLGQCYGAGAHYEQDLAKFDGALSSPGAHNSANYYQGRAALSIAAGEYRKALVDLDKASLRSFDQDRIKVSRAYCYEKLGELGPAYREYSLVLDSNPQRYELYTKRGEVAVEQHRYDRALSDLETAVAVMPEDWKAYLLLGQIFGEQKLYSRAIACYHRALQLQPANTVAPIKIAQYTKLNRLAYGRTPVNKAVLAHQLMLKEIAASDLPTLKQKGYAALTRGDLEYAVPALMQAITLNPNDPLVRQYLAYALIAAGDYSGAVDQYHAWDKLAKLDLYSKLSFTKRFTQPGSLAAAALLDEFIRDYKTDAPSLRMIAAASEAQGYDAQAQAAVLAGLKVAQEPERRALLGIAHKLEQKKADEFSKFSPEEQKQLGSYVRPQ